MPTGDEVRDQELTHVVLEQFVVSIHPNQESEFEAAMERALRTVMARAEGMRGWSLRRCVETLERYQVQLQWDWIEADMVGYRQGPACAEVSRDRDAVLRAAAEMRHFEELAYFEPQAQHFATFHEAQL